MSFTGTTQQGAGYAPGWFLANELCSRQTRQISQTGAQTGPDGSKYVKMGTIWPANDATAEGIVYEDIDVTTGDMPGSVVTQGMVYEDRLPAMAEAAKTALKGRGFVFLELPKVTRPY